MSYDVFVSVNQTWIHHFQPETKKKKPTPSVKQKEAFRISSSQEGQVNNICWEDNGLCVLFSFFIKKKIMQKRFYAWFSRMGLQNALTASAEE